LEDKLIWKREKSGKCSVCSVYRICVSEIADNSHLHVLGMWNSIWKLKVCPKVKNFLWRVCRYCFPSLAHLSSKRVSFPVDFVLCNSSSEENIHVLMECPKVVQAMCDVNL
jgi:hypothetical protein